MKHRTKSGKVSGLTVVLVVVGVAVIGLFVGPSISNSNESKRLETEINRVADETGTKPSSVQCRNVEFATICYAQYSGTSNRIEEMLKNSGYSVVSTKKGSISASNQGTSVRVDSEPESSKNTITLKFKDINVTL